VTERWQTHDDSIYQASIVLHGKSAHGDVFGVKMGKWKRFAVLSL